MGAGVTLAWETPSQALLVCSPGSCLHSPSLCPPDPGGETHQEDQALMSGLGDVLKPTSSRPSPGPHLGLGLAQVMDQVGTIQASFFLSFQQK